MYIIDAMIRVVPAEKTRSNTERSAETRAALIDVATKLFAEHGYAGVATEQVVREAKVTRGALYHHFKDKRDLFVAVFERQEEQAMIRVAEQLGPQTDPWVIALRGSEIFLDICLEPAFQRIAIIDAPTVVGTGEQQEIADRYGGAMVKATITALVEAGEIPPQPVDTLQRMYVGAVVAGAMVIAQAKNKKAARKEVGAVLESLLRGLAK